MEKAASLGIKDVWLHMNSDTPRALQVAREHGINLRYSTCAVMYVSPGLTFHSIHRWVQKGPRRLLIRLFGGSHMLRFAVSGFPFALRRNWK